MSATAVSDFNLQKINTKELADNINATIDFGGNLLAIARRGTGKTTIAKDLVAESGYKEVYMNLSLMERPDIGGYPNFFGSRNGEKFINFLMPSIFKDLIEGDQKCVAILDEVDKADNTLLAPLLEFVQARSVNNYKLKNLHAIIMTGNLLAEGGQRPPLTLLDRTEKFLVEINPKHWLDWGSMTREIHPSISAYIAENLHDLCGEIDPDADSYATTSPRGWHSASKLVYYGERKGWHPSMLVHKVAACVGKKAGLKYSTFFEHYQILLPTVDKIMKGEHIESFSKFENTKKLVVCMMLCSRFANMLDDLAENKDSDEYVLPEHLVAISNNVSNFLCSVDPEMALISIRGQISAKRIMTWNLVNDKNWSALLDKLVKKVNL